MAKDNFLFLTEPLLDPDEIFDEEKVKARNAKAVYDCILAGASVEDLLEAFNYKHLKDALSYYNIRGRSNLTYMKDMAIVLVRELSNELSKQRAGTKLDVEYNQIKEKENEYKEEIYQLQHKIAKLEERIKKLEWKNEKLKKYKKRYKELKQRLK